MSNSKIFKCALVLSVCAAIMASCTKPIPPVIRVSNEISVSSVAGIQNIPFNIENASAAKLVATSDAQWLEVIVAEQDIQLFYQANDDYSQRKANVTLSYPEANDVVLVVTQIGKAIVPIISVAENPVELNPNGGTQSIAYTIENSSNNKLVASSDASWLNVTVKDSEIVLAFDANETGEARNANIALYYPEAQQVVISASQAVQPVPFTITINCTDPKNFSATITPSDDDMYFFWDIDSKAYVEYFDNDKDFIDETIESWSYFAEGYGMTLAELMEDYFAEKGKVEITADDLDLKYGTSYYMYAFGLKDDFETPYYKLVKVEFTTDEVGPVEKIEMTFDMSITEEEDHSVTYEIVATPDDQYFYAGVLDAEGLEDYSADEIADVLWDIVYAEIEDYLDYWDWLIPIGYDAGNYADLEPSTDYLLIAFGVDKDFGVISNAEMMKFTSPSEPVVPSSVSVKPSKVKTNEYSAKLPRHCEFRPTRHSSRIIK